MKMSQTDRKVDFSDELIDLETILSQNTLQSILGQHEIVKITNEILSRRNSQTSSVLETATSATSSTRQESVVSNEIRPQSLDLTPLFAKIQANFDALYEENLRLKEQLLIANTNCICKRREVVSMVEKEEDQTETDENESQEQDILVILPDDEHNTNTKANNQSNRGNLLMCDVCRKCFENKAGLSIHKARIHSTKPKLEFECENCKRILMNRTALISHQKSCLNDPGLIDTRASPRVFKVVFECDFCHFKFSTDSSLQRHLRSH